MILLCGRYEGFDHRVVELLNPTEISVGDYVLNGGEVAAMVLVDAAIRMIPGVLGTKRAAGKTRSLAATGSWNSLNILAPGNTAD